MIETLGHASRATPARWYLRGLMLPGQRKSVEPMAARVHPQHVGSAHQSMHHLVADSEWSDTTLLAAVAREVVPVLSQEGQAPCCWIIDDTSYRKWGKHSVGVARQYCGHLGKTENCQVAVSLTLATPEGSLPLNYRLYLPHEWTRNKKRCQAAGVPKAVRFAPKGQIAWAQIEAALAAGLPRGTVLMDAAYGFLMLERLAGSKKTPLDCQRLPYPKPSARAGLGPMQCHIPWSIATARHRLARAIARGLPQCPCCGKPYRRAAARD